MDSTQLFIYIVFGICILGAILLLAYVSLYMYGYFIGLKEGLEKEAKKEENKTVEDKRIGSIKIGVNNEVMSFPLLDLEQFKRKIKDWKEDEFLTFYNGIIKCSEIKYIQYFQNEGVKDLGFWDSDDGFDNDKEDDKPEPPAPSGKGKKTEEDEEDDKWLKSVLDDVGMAKKE